MAVEFLLLGDIEAHLDGRRLALGHSRQCCVLAALLVDANRPVPVHQLADRVWGGCPPQRASGTLYSYLSRLRQVLSPADGVVIRRQPGGYVLTVDAMAVDLHRFHRLVGEARAAQDHGRALVLRRALGLWRSDAFAGLDTPWLNSVRDTLEVERHAAQLECNDLALERGEHAALLGGLCAGAASHPLDERLAGQLMLALYRCGRQADALDHYQQVRLRLADELGADPSRGLRRLHQQMLMADAHVGVPDRTGAATARHAPPAALVPRQLPAPLPSFSGRDGERVQLTAMLERSPDHADPVIAVIGGAGGMGKTCLAVRWAHDHLDRFPDGQLYANLRGFDPSGAPTPSNAVLYMVLEALGVAPETIPVDGAARAGLYRSLVAGKRMLILLDNARDTEQVLPLLPGSSTSTVLVTSRHQLAGLVTAHGARRLTLDVLMPAEARQLLASHLGAARVVDDAGATASLIRHCAGLPLALSILAARAVGRPDFPLAAFADELGAVSTRLDALDAGELAVNLRAVLSCSYEALSPEAAQVFRMLGLAPGPDIGLPAAASLTAQPAARVRGLVRQLVATHMVQEPAPDRYRMHDLVRLYATELACELTSAPTGVSRCTGCSTTTCTPLTPRTGCSIRTGTRSGSPRRSREWGRRPSAVTPMRCRGSRPSTWCCARPSSARPRRGSTPTPGTWHGRSSPSVSGGGTGTTRPPRSAPRSMTSPARHTPTAASRGCRRARAGMRRRCRTTGSAGAVPDRGPPGRSGQRAQRRRLAPRAPGRVRGGPRVL